MKVIKKRGVGLNGDGMSPISDQLNTTCHILYNFMYDRFFYNFCLNYFYIISARIC